MGIYKILNNVTGKFYIGSTVDFEKRFYEHTWDLNKNTHHSKHLQRAWSKYGQDNFSFLVIEIVDTEDSLKTREQWHIDLLKPYKRNIGYNVSCDASAPMRGRRHTLEMRRHFSLTRSGINHPWYGKKHSEESKKKMSAIQGDGRNAGCNNSFYGRSHTDETKRKISQANKGRERSEQLKQHYSKLFKGPGNPFYGERHNERSLQKMSENRRGKCKGSESPLAKAIVQLGKNGQYIRTYDTVTEAAEKAKAQRSHIALVCRGKRKHAGGFKWIYYEDYIKLHKTS